MPNISVIIPVYNVENYLPRCLGSVCNQTLKNIEIIVVDDASTDNSAQIVQAYASKYDIVKAVYLEANQGAAVARNIGMDVAQGDYLAFVDSDDEIDLNFYETLYERAKDQDADIVKGQMIEIADNGKEQIVQQINEIENSKFLFVNCWTTAIYKRSLIAENALVFEPEYVLAEDILFLNKMLTVAQNIQCVSDVYYRYYRRENSEDAKILSDKKVISALKVFEKVINTINVVDGVSDATYQFFYHHFIMSCFYLSLRNDDEKVRKMCAQKASDIFEKNRDKQSLAQSFQFTSPYLCNMLQIKDVSGLGEALIKYKSRMEIVSSGLRAKLSFGKVLK